MVQAEADSHTPGVVVLGADSKPLPAGAGILAAETTDVEPHFAAVPDGIHCFAKPSPELLVESAAFP